MSRSRLTVSPSALAVLLFFLLADRSVIGILPIVAAAIHECGHIAVIRLFGLPIHAIRLTVFGAEIDTSAVLPSRGKAVAVSAAGATANLVSGAAAMAVCPIVSENYRLFCGYFAASSFVLAAVNLLPIRSLDGGAIVETICPSVAPILSGVTLFLLWIVAGYLLLYFGGNLSLCGLCVYLFASLYLTGE